MTRRLALLLLLVCGLAACGGKSSPSPEDAVQGYIDGIADGNGAEVCSHLTGAALRKRGGKNCAAVVRRATGKLSRKDAEAIRKLKFTVASVKGDKAMVRVVVPQAACDAAKVQLLGLVRKDDVWRISRTSDTACASQF